MYGNNITLLHEWENENFFRNIDLVLNGTKIYVFQFTHKKGVYHTNSMYLDR